MAIGLKRCAIWDFADQIGYLGAHISPPVMDARTDALFGVRAETQIGSQNTGALAGQGHLASRLAGGVARHRL